MLYFEVTTFCWLSMCLLCIQHNISLAFYSAFFFFFKNNLPKAYFHHRHLALPKISPSRWKSLCEHQLLAALNRTPLERLSDISTFPNSGVHSLVLQIHRSVQTFAFWISFGSYINSDMCGSLEQACKKLVQFQFHNCYTPPLPTKVHDVLQLDLKTG